MKSLTQHPLSAAFPAMLTDEFQELKDSINIVGVLNPITLLDGMVLDGWHRYSIATEFGMDCPMVVLDHDIDPVDFVKAQNFARRKLTPSQAAFACTRLYAWRPAHRLKKSVLTADLTETNKQLYECEVTSPLSKTNAEMAVIAGTTTRTIQQAKVVHAGAVSAVQNAVTIGAVSLETAAAVAKMPAIAQKAIAAAGPDAMRAAAKSKSQVAFKSGGRAKATGNVATPTGKTAAEQNAEDAHGGQDTLELLEAAYKEIEVLQAQITVAEADDAKAESMKWQKSAAVATRRQNELMDTVNAREKELKRLMNIIRRICGALGDDDQSKIATKVEAMARDCREVFAARAEKNIHHLSLTP